MSLIYLVFKLTATAAFGTMNIMNNCDSGDTVLTVLAFSCFALAEYLLSVLKKSDKAAAVCSCVSAFIAFLIYSDNLIFVLCFAVIYAVDKFGAGKYFRHIGAVSVLLVLFIVKPPFIDVLILIIMLVAFTVSHITAGQLIKCREQLADSREETVRLNRRIASLEEYAKTAKKSAAKKEIKTEVVLQYGEKEVNTKDMIASVKKDWTKQKHKISEIKSIELYVKPEDYAVYYVINGEHTGKVWL